VEGGLLRPEIEYRGGSKGKSRHAWYRVQATKDPYGEPTRIPGAEGPEYHVAEDDVGCFLMFEYIPVRADGETGPAVTASTGLIEEALPQVFGATLVGGGAPHEGLNPICLCHGKSL